MIQVKVNKSISKLAVTGDMATLAAESGVMIRKIYTALPKEAAEEFRRVFTKFVAATDSPLFRKRNHGRD